MTHDLENRMKRYESVSDHYLVRRTPVIGRLDGRSFHTLTRDCKRPFDEIFIKSMQVTALLLCEEIQGCKMAYTQSDEITLLLIDYDTIQTEPWFNYRLNKMCSIAASLASLTFSHMFGKLGQFDARFFNVPENDVCNAFIYKQKDCERNSLTMYAQSVFSHKELMHKRADDKHQMLHEKGFNWNDLPTYLKRGSCARKGEDGWFIDKEPPVFSQDRKYIEGLYENLGKS